MSIKRLCCAPGCSRFRIDGSDYCDRHQNLQQERDQKRAEHTRQYFENRPRVDCKFYSTSRWRTARERFLSVNQYCQICGDQSTQIHHDWPTKDYLEDENMFFDVSHWIPVCAKCHTKISNSRANVRPTSLNYSGDL